MSAEEKIRELTRENNKLRAPVKQRAERLRAVERLLRECDVVLTMVPATSKPDSWMGLLQTEYIAPLLKKVRGQSYGGSK